VELDEDVPLLSARARRAVDAYRMFAAASSIGEGRKMSVVGCFVIGVGHGAACVSSAEFIVYTSNKLRSQLSNFPSS
jgi:hypothetical protein